MCHVRHAKPGMYERGSDWICVTGIDLNHCGLNVCDSARRNEDKHSSGMGALIL